jgi:hypothetical protein
LLPAPLTLSRAVSSSLEAFHEVAPVFAALAFSVLIQRNEGGA